MTTPAPNFGHLLALTDRRGTFEHARFSEPRREHGYCTDDMARVLVVASRQSRPTPEVRGLAALSLRFLATAQGLDGDYRNRLDVRGHWADRRSVEDCWGRSVWGLGTAAAHSTQDWVRQTAACQLERAAHRRSPWPRAMAYAAIGAAEALRVDGDSWVVRRLLVDAADAMPPVGDDPAWPWPEPRLHYANAVLPEAMIAAGDALRRPQLVRDGLTLLAWLVAHETRDGHLSVTAAGGRDPGDVGPTFDQQPIEVAALADACARAATVDADPRWNETVSAAVGWFLGDNDAGLAMRDPESGGGFDGLEAIGVNRNQGAESTLALLSTLQHGRRLQATVR